jgi:hypothetical protein
MITPPEREAAAKVDRFWDGNPPLHKGLIPKRLHGNDRKKDAKNESNIEGASWVQVNPTLEASDGLPCFCSLYPITGTRVEANPFKKFLRMPKALIWLYSRLLQRYRRHLFRRQHRFIYSSN